MPVSFRTICISVCRATGGASSRAATARFDDVFSSACDATPPRARGRRSWSQTGLKKEAPPPARGPEGEHSFASIPMRIGNGPDIEILEIDCQPALPLRLEDQRRSLHITIRRKRLRRSRLSRPLPFPEIQARLGEADAAYRATCSSHGQDGRPRQAKPRAASRFHLGAARTGAARFVAHKEAGRDQKHKASGHIRFAAGCIKGGGALRYREILPAKTAAVSRQAYARQEDRFGLRQVERI